MGWLTPASLPTLAATIEAERYRRAKLLRAAEDDRAVRAYLAHRSRRDPLFWMDQFFWSYDPERDGSPHVPTVLWPFQREYVRFFLGVDDDHRTRDGDLWPIVLDKSRKLGATWVTLAAVMWDWLFNPKADYGILTRSGTDLDGGEGPQSLFGKLDYLLTRLPWWLIPDHRRGRTPLPSLYNRDTGSTIEGSKTVRSAFRGKRHRRDVVDEAAFVPAMDAVMTSLNDVSKAPCLVSTPCGKGNEFARHVHGDGVDTFDAGDHHGKTGWLHLRMHYSQHPDRDPRTRRGRRWVEIEKAKRTDQAWAQEQEIDYEASLPGQIWPEWGERSHIYPHDQWQEIVAEGYLSSCRVIEAWDFGWGASLTCVVWAAHVEATDRVIMLDYRAWKGIPYDEVAAGVAAAGWRCRRNPTGREPDLRIGDISGKARDSSMTSWIRNLRRDEGIDITGRTLDGEAARAKVRQAIKHHRLLGAPAIKRRYDGQQDDAPTLSESIGQYRRQMKETGTGKPIKDRYSHLADCVQYIADEVWPVALPASMRSQDPLHG